MDDEDLAFLKDDEEEDTEELIKKVKELSLEISKKDENKLKAKMAESYKEILIKILSKKEEEIFKDRKYIKKAKESRYHI